MNDKEKLVAYFSCSGNTARVAQEIAKTTGADLFEIKPEKPYTARDLDWTDKSSRSTLEMKDTDCRPAIKNDVNTDGYSVIFLGFPIWWYVAPRIVQTFVENHDLSGKTVVPFFTSGSSGAGRTDEELHKCASDSVVWKKSRRFKVSAGREEIEQWIRSLGI